MKTKEEQEKERDRLAKLLRLLSSDKDGEILAAVKALERTLKAAGKSFHDLADTIVDKVIILEVQSYASNYEEACKWLLKRDLKDHEFKFVIDMQRRFKLVPDFKPTEKQAGWFSALVRRFEEQDRCQTATSGGAPQDRQTQPPF